jgi:hypothetical protein
MDNTAAEGLAYALMAQADTEDGIFVRQVFQDVEGDTGFTGRAWAG